MSSHDNDPRHNHPTLTWDRMSTWQRKQYGVKAPAASKPKCPKCQRGFTPIGGQPFCNACGALDANGVLVKVGDPVRIARWQTATEESGAELRTGKVYRIEQQSDKRWVLSIEWPQEMNKLAYSYAFSYDMVVVATQACANCRADYTPVAGAQSDCCPACVLAALSKPAPAVKPFSLRDERPLVEKIPARDALAAKEQAAYKALPPASATLGLSPGDVIMSEFWAGGWPHCGAYLVTCGPYRIESVGKPCTCPEFNPAAGGRSGPPSESHFHLECTDIRPGFEGKKKGGSYLAGYVQRGHRWLSVWPGKDYYTGTLNDCPLSELFLVERAVVKPGTQLTLF